MDSSLKICDKCRRYFIKQNKKKTGFVLMVLVIVMAMNCVPVMAATERSVTCCEDCGSRNIWGSGTPEQNISKIPCQHGHNGYIDTAYWYVTNVKYTCDSCGHIWFVKEKSGYVICGYDNTKYIEEVTSFGGEDER